MEGKRARRNQPTRRVCKVFIWKVVVRSGTSRRQSNPLLKHSTPNVSSHLHSDLHHAYIRLWVIVAITIHSYSSTTFSLPSHVAHAFKTKIKKHMYAGDGGITNPCLRKHPSGRSPRCQKTKMDPIQTNKKRPSMTFDENQSAISKCR